MMDDLSRPPEQTLMSIAHSLAQIVAHISEARKLDAGPVEHAQAAVFCSLAGRALGARRRDHYTLEEDIILYVAERQRAGVPPEQITQDLDDLTARAQNAAAFCVTYARSRRGDHDRHEKESLRAALTRLPVLLDTDVLLSEEERGRFAAALATLLAAIE